MGQLRPNSKCQMFSSEFESITPFIFDTCWMNPPLSKAEEMFTPCFNVIQTGVAIYRCDNMETSVWQDIILKNASWVFIPNYRIKYEGFDGKGSRFPSAIIGKGVEVPLNLKGKTLFLIGAKCQN